MTFSSEKISQVLGVSQASEFNIRLSTDSIVGISRTDIESGQKRE